MLSKKTVLKIKNLLSEDKLTQAEIAKQFKISRSLVSDIATGRSYGKVEGPEAPVKAPKGQRKKSTANPEEKILDLEAETVHLREELRLAKRQLLGAVKTRGLFTAMADELHSTIKPIKALPSARPKIKSAAVTEHLVMHLSDGHHDQVVTPDECGGLEQYDFKVSMCRAENYIDTVLKWTQETLAPKFNFPSLTILAYGDHTSGEIHGHANRSYFRNQMKSCLAIGQLHSLMFRDLAPYFETVNIVYVPGNHGRRSLTKDYHGAHDNWDYLLAKTAELYCADIENVHFTIPNAFSANLDIGGIGFSVFHGDDIRSSLGIPWYGLERRTGRIIALNQVTSGPRIKYFAAGHFHRSGTTPVGDGELLLNGSWVATDSYVYNSFSGYTEPTQLLHGVHERYGVTWRLPVKLRCDYERSGPKRYKIDLLEN